MGEDDTKDMKGFLVLGFFFVLIPAVLQGIGFNSVRWASNSTCGLDIKEICCMVYDLNDTLGYNYSHCTVNTYNKGKHCFTSFALFLMVIKNLTSSCVVNVSIPF